MKIVQKAWQVDLSKIEEGYYYSKDIKYAETRSKAKSQYCWDDYSLIYGEGACTYLTLPVIRCKEADKYEFEGEQKTKQQIGEIKNERKRQAKLDSMLNDPNITYCYIDKGGYYCPGWSGYTSFKSKAGVYTIEEGIQHAKSVREVHIVPINIQEHNEIIEKEINDLKSRLL